MTVFSISGLAAGYRSKTVLRNINIDISRGEFVGVIGPNGSGKSTLIKAMTGNISHSEGGVLFMERPLGEYAGTELAGKISVVYQSIENALPFTAMEFVRMGRFPHQSPLKPDSSGDRKIAGDIMRMMGIERLAERPITEISGGERQLVFIARALAQNSDVILLDEPISHLDITHSVQIMDALYDLHMNGSTVISVLHDINMAAEYCTRIIALKDGEVFADGSPEELINYKTVESLFNTVCIVVKNPVSNKPHTYPVPAHHRKKSK
jgi:iron complex transport system ATP-binding protein